MLLLCRGEESFDCEGCWGCVCWYRICIRIFFGFSYGLFFPSVSPSFPRARPETLNKSLLQEPVLASNNTRASFSQARIQYRSPLNIRVHYPKPRSALSLDLRFISIWILGLGKFVISLCLIGLTCDMS